MRPGFRTVVTLLFTLLMAVTVLLVTGTSYQRARDGVMEMGNRLIDSKVERISMLTSELGRRSSDTLDQLALTIGESELLADHQRLWRHLWAAAHHSSFYNSVFVADTEGNFLQARKEPNLATRVNRFAVDDPHEQWVVRDQEYRPLATVRRDSEYDPTARPWYRLALEAGGLIWTPVYQWDAIRQSGFTIARPVYLDGGVAGVVGIDVSLERINLFVADESLGEGAVMLIVNGSGELIAYPNTLVSGSAEGANLALTPVTALPQQWIGEAYRVASDSLQGGEAGVTSATIDGEEYFVRLAPITHGLEDEWRLLLVVPERLVLGSVQRGLSTSLMLAGILLIVAIYTIYLVVARLSLPLSQLVSNANALARFRFDDVEPLTSGLPEFMRLSDSMQQMGHNLATYSHYVPLRLIRQLLTTPGGSAIGGEERSLTLMIVEVDRIGALLAQLPADHQVDYLTRYQSLVIHHLHHAGATIDHMSGGSVVAFWGAPVAREQQQDHAARSAIDLLAAINELNQQLRQEGLPLFEPRIALHLDRFLVGNLGSEEWRTYTLVGEGSAICRQLLDLNRDYATRILVSDPFRQSLAAGVLLRQIDRLDDGALAGPLHELVGIDQGADSDGRREAIERFEEVLALLLDGSDPATALSRLESLAALHPSDGVIRYHLDRLQGGGRA